MRHTSIQSKITIFMLVLCLCTLGISSQSDPDKKDKKDENPPKISEEIVVTAKMPALQPLSTVSLIEGKTLSSLLPKNLGEILNFIPGSLVTEGQKKESHIQIRGLGSQRLTLLYDGVPIYEPYFNSFDLNSLAATGIQNIKVIKGANSVLYGANTLGGVINVVSRRPESSFFTLESQFSRDATYFLSGTGGLTFEKFNLIGNATWDQSDGFRYLQDGDLTLRELSDYSRLNLSAKAYYYPTEKSEIMAQVMFHTADYGVPAATEILKARYWRFSDWQRLQLNVGSMFPMFGNGLLKTRVYYVEHYNVLDAYNTLQLDSTQWKSTYDNHSYGAFILGEIPVSKANEIRFSLNAKKDVVKTQGDVGEEWENFEHQTYSIGVEDHLSLSRQFKLIAGVSLDYLKKQDGENKTRLNPIVGIKYIPRPYLDIHLSFAQKSRFPSMRSLYSTSSGNPDLRDETGRNFELGVSYYKNIQVDVSLFYNLIDDMIQSYRGLDGYKNYQNIGEAKIAGFEIGVNKHWKGLNLSLNYTFLDAKDRYTDEDLDYIAQSQFNAVVQVGPFKGFSAFLWGMAASSSIARLGKEPPFDILTIPGHTLINMKVEKKIALVTLFVKVENLLNADYFTEPGFPMKGRTVSIGFQAGMGGRR